MLFGRRRPGPRAASVLAVLAVLATAAIAAPAQAREGQAHPPAPTVSRYAPLEGGSADLSRAREWGCAAGASGRSGLRLMFVGTQEAGGVLRGPGTSGTGSALRTDAYRAVEVARQWARSFAECRTGGATAVLALGVNNKEDGGMDGAAAGREWADMVAQAHREAEYPGVQVAGAVDAEPGWSGPEFARAWVEAFTGRTDLTLYTANSADGCPWEAGSWEGCNNGWSLADLHFVSSGAAETMHAVPQIYRTDGVQARQWAHLSAWGAHSGEGPVRFAGALSQQRACEQRGCQGTDNPPETAWSQLRRELDARPETRDAHLPYATDMRWPE